MITYAATIPFADCLLDKESAVYLRTIAAIERIREDLLSTKPDLVVLITAPEHTIPKTFSVQLEQMFTTKGSLKSFGIIESQEYPPAIDIIARIQSKARSEHQQIVTVQDPVLDTSVAAALKLLQLPKLPLCIIGTNEQSALAHAEFGYLVKDVLQHSDKRIAIIAIEHLPLDAGSIEQVQTAVIQRSVAACNQIIQKSKTYSILKSLALVSGLLRGFPANTRLLAYEANKKEHLISAILFSD